MKNRNALKCILGLAVVAMFLFTTWSTARALIFTTRGNGVNTTSSASIKTTSPVSKNLLTTSAFTATVATDKADYPPGSTVVITGSGWQPGETVNLKIEETDGDAPWLSFAIADSSGNISNNQFVIQSHDVGVLFTLTATGQSSGQTATTTFTDGLVNPDQGENGGFGNPPIDPVDWINGNVQSQKGHFVEGQSTIYRAQITGLTAGVPARFLIFFSITQSGKHSLDFLTGPKRIAECVQPTDGLTFGSFPGTRSTFPIPLPPTSAPQTRAFAAAQQAADAARGVDAHCSNDTGDVEGNRMWIWNGTITSIHYSSSSTVTGTDTWGDENSMGNTDTFAEITFTPSSSSVLLSWGAHIASENDWGVGNGATGIMGSPYHMHMARICTDASLADNQCTSIGNQDLQLAAAAVCNPPVATALLPQTVCKGSTATFSTTATGSGTLSFQWKIDGVNTSTGVTSTATTSSISIDTTNLSAGNHTVSVTVTSNSSCGSPGDTQSTTLTVDQVALTLSKTDITCNGANDGTITATVTSGASPFMFSLDNGSFVSGTSPFTFKNVTPGSHTVTVKDNNTCTAQQSVTINEPSVVTLSLSKTDVSCNGSSDGSVTATFGGGTAPYMIKLDAGAFAAAGASPQTFSGLAAGSHTVTVKDANSCTQSASITVNQPDAVTLSLSKTDVSCNGGSDGSVTATFGGGTAPYMIKLDSGSFAAATSPATFNNLSAGSHSVTVKDANGCTQSDSINVGQPSAVTLSLSKTDVSCNGGSDGSVTATFGGGTAPYMIKLDSGSFAPAGASPQTFSGLVAGSHTVTVKDANGCTKSDSITVNQPNVLVLSLSKTDVTCNGAANGTITASATGGTTPYQFKLDAGSFQSSGSFIGVGPGSHTVMVKDAHNCTDSKSITINEPPLLTCSITPPSQNPVCGTSGNSLSATVTGGTLPYGLTWSIAGIGWSVDSGQGTTSIKYTAGPSAGIATFTLKITDALGCMHTCTLDVACSPPQIDNCTLTQGFYGNQKGKFNGIPGPQLVTMLLSTGDLVVGKPGRSLTISGGASAADSAKCLVQRMPGNQTPMCLPDFGDQTLNTGTCQTSPALPLNGQKWSNVLLGQVVALSLNLRLDTKINEPGHTPLADRQICNTFTTQGALPGPDGLLGTSDDTINPNGSPATFSIPVSVTCALTHLGLPHTVGGILELANRALACQCTDVASLGDINQACDAINQGFDGCRFLLSCTDSSAACPSPATCTSARLLIPNSENGDLVVAQASSEAGSMPLANLVGLFSWNNSRGLLSRWAAIPVAGKSDFASSWLSVLSPPDATGRIAHRPATT